MKYNEAVKSKSPRRIIKMLLELCLQDLEFNSAKSICHQKEQQP